MDAVGKREKNASGICLDFFFFSCLFTHLAASQTQGGGGNVQCTRTRKMYT